MKEQSHEPAGMQLIEIQSQCWYGLVLLVVKAAYGPIAEEDAIGFEGQHFLCRVVCWDNGYFAAKGCQPPQDVLLDAEIICNHLRTCKTSSLYPGEGAPLVLQKAA